MKNYLSGKILNKALLSVLAIALHQNVFASADKETAMKNKPEYYHLSVDSVKIDTTESAKGRVTVTVYGVLPNPSYQFDHFDIVRDGNLITITPLATHDPNKIVIQLIIPYKEKCQIKYDQKGKNWKININGSNKIFTKSVS
jgi:uncharacterized protein (DUF2249 family)